MNAHAKPVAEATILATTIPARDLAQAMRLICRVIPRWSISPALSYVHLTATAGEITLRAMDMDVELTLRLEAETARKGQVMIRAAGLLAFAEAAMGPVTIEGRTTSASATQPEIVVLQDQQFVSRQRAIINTDDLPVMDVSGDTTASWTQSQGQLRRMLSMCRRCISTEETRYYLNGVFVTTNPEGGMLRAVATDGHRLARIDTDTAPVGQPEHIIPIGAVDLLMALTKTAGNDPITVQLTGKNITVTGPDFVLRGHLIDGHFPDYQRVIPKAEGQIRATLSAQMLKRLRIVARTFGDYYKHAVFDIDNQTINVRCAEDDVAIACQIHCPAGDLAKPFGVNLGYLADQAVITPTYSICCTSPSDPLIIRGDDPDALFVIMPVRV